MVADKIIYTDGHEVVVTNSFFQVKTDQFRLNGIIRHGLQKIRPRRLPGLILIALGILLGVTSYITAWPARYFNELQLLDATLPAMTVAYCLAGILLLIGMLTLGLLKERYAVRIETAEGEKNVVVSTKQEYIRQILRALNRAVGFRGNSKSTV